MIAAAVLCAWSTNGYAQEDRVRFSFGTGVTVPDRETRARFGDGYNIVFGLVVDVTRNIGIEGLMSTNILGEQQLSVAVSQTPGAVPVPTDFSVSMKAQFATANLVVRAPTASVRPYGIIGAGIYNRLLSVTTNATGGVAPSCDPWWRACQASAFVPIEELVGQRNSLDFGMDVGGGVNFAFVFVEGRYHYIWGIQPEDARQISDTPMAQKAAGQYIAASFGVRF